jgi:hypothetical protein
MKAISCRRWLSIVMTCLAFGMAVSSPAAAKIFKCESRGHVAYQDSPCPRNASATVMLETSASKSTPAPVTVPMPPALDVRSFKAPASMSLLEIYKQLQLLSKRSAVLHKGMQQEMAAPTETFKASIKTLKNRPQIMTAWASETRKSVRQTRALSDEGARLSFAFAKELRAVNDSPQDAAGPPSAAREQAMVRIQQKWMPKIRQNERQMHAAQQAMQRQNQSYGHKVDSFDRELQYRALRDRYNADTAPIRHRWSPRIQIVDARQKALLAELRSRCPRGSALSPDKQQCYR